MAQKDIYLITKADLLSNLEKSRELHQSWKRLKLEGESNDNVIHFVETELKNVLRAITWDLEDLSETITLVDRSTNNVKLDVKEIQNRRNFVEQTKKEVKLINNDLTDYKPNNRETAKSVTSLLNSNLTFGNTSTTKYSRLLNELESPSSRVYNDLEIKMEDNGTRSSFEKLNSTSMNTSPNAARADEHAVMLDEFGNGTELNDGSRFNPTFKKFTKVLRHNESKTLIMVAIGICLIVVVILILHFKVTN